jgi:hypothetical protein
VGEEYADAEDEAVGDELKVRVSMVRFRRGPSSNVMILKVVFFGRAALRVSKRRFWTTFWTSKPCADCRLKRISERVASAEPTLAQALDWYLEQETPEKKGNEQETRRIKGWKARELMRLRLSQLTPMHFVEFRKQGEAEGRAGNTIR